ncbi:hypothetical protein OPQ81_010264 [Rhizoctonia solani]|nr:hypothetical protein OPQ81_010264 [Rhizoctonia solani]
MTTSVKVQVIYSDFQCLNARQTPDSESRILPEQLLPKVEQFGYRYIRGTLLVVQSPEEIEVTRKIRMQ